MKRNRALTIFGFLVLISLALTLFASPASPQVAYAQRVPTNTPTKIVRPTRFKPQPTDTFQPTATATSTLTPLPTSTPTRTPTHTPVPTSTHTPTFTPTATAFPTSVRLNEILTFPKFKDWNKDEHSDNDDQWIELYNLGDHPADVSGWRIDTGDKTPFFTIPNGAMIPPGGFLIFFRKQTRLDVDHYDRLRLLFPDGSISDQLVHPPLDEDRVYARAQNGAGGWRTGCVPSPLATNCQTEETYTSQFNLPYFKQHIFIPGPSMDMQVLTTNIVLAIILALAIGFFSNLLNDAIESHESDLALLSAPLTRLGSKVRGAFRSLNLILTYSRLRWIGFAFKFLVILMVYGAILAFLDPNFRFITQDSFMLILALGLSTGFVALADDLATYLYLRLRGASGEIRFHSANFVLVVFSTLFSRLTGLVPGLLIGSPAGIEEVPDEHSGPHLDILAIMITAAFGGLAWALIPVYEADPWLNTLLLLMFAAGIQTVFFEMLPISYLRGKGIFQFNRLLWALLFGLAAAAFLQTMLNPDGAFLEAFRSTNMILLSLFVMAYCIFCTLIWLWLTRLANKRALEKAAIK